MTVTIAIPFFGDDLRGFRDAVRSVFAQTYSDWHLMLVDDGGAAPLLKAARDIEDSRVRVVTDGENRGLAARLNQIARMTSTPFLFRMDADDMMFPRRVEMQQAALSSDPTLDVVGGKLIAMDGNDRILGYYARRRRTATPAELLAAPIFSHPTVAGRTSWFQHNPYDESIRRAEDKELWLRTFRTSNFHTVDDPVLFYRTNTEFNRQKVLQTCRDDRRATSSFAKAELNLAQRAKFIARSYAKEAMYTCVGQRAWDSGFSKRVTDGQAAREHFAAHLATVKSTVVKGWTT